MQRRAVWVVVTLCLVVAACGTRVTEEVGSTATSLVQRTTTDSGSATATDGTTVVTIDPGSTDGGGTTTGGTTGSGTTGGTGSATTGGATNRPASGAPIVLGAVGTKSGLIGNALINGFRGLTVWEKWVNSHGGIQGRPVRVIQVDDAGDPGKHAAAVRKLIREDRVVAFIGNIAPFTLSAGMPLLEEAGVAALGGDGGDATWFRSPNAFPINGQSVARSRPAARWAIKNLPMRKAAVFYVSEAEASTTLAQNFVDEYKKAGGQVPINVGVSLATPDFTGEVVQAKNAGIELVFILLEKAACNRFMDAALRQDYKPIIIAPACTIDNARGHKSLTTNRLYSAASVRSAYRGFIVTPGQQEALEAGTRFDPGLALDGAFMFGWLAGKLLQEAMAQPGTVVTPKGIIDALHKLPATTLGGIAPTQSWPPGNHPEGRCGLISKFDGENFILQTKEFLCA